MRVLALDIGSSSTRAALFDGSAARTTPIASRTYDLRYSDDGAAELDPVLLRRAVRAVYAKFKSRRADVIASCAFWHGLLGLDKNLRPLTPIYTWGDSRARADAAQLRNQFREDDVLQRTGCVLRFAFWPAKLRWLRRTNPRLFKRVVFWVSPSDWLLHSLFGELFTSPSMASATGLFNERTRTWNSEMCEAAYISGEQLPPIRDSRDSDGRLLSTIGDGAASNFGSGAVKDDCAAISLGTSAAVRVMTRRMLRVPAGLFRFVAGRDTFVLGGATSNCGNLHAWCTRELQTLPKAKLLRDEAAGDQLVALPFFVAERAPDWPEIAGAISGLSLGTTRTQISRALMVSALYRVADIFDDIETAVGRVKRIIVSGGMTKLSGLVQVLADVLARDIEVAADTEASLRGAAVHAFALTGELPRIARPGRRVYFDKGLSKMHRQRREEQREFEERLQDSASMRSKRG
ncbi:MAG: carbohydrate kinase [Verrucomicrobia bacterium]|nr:carbohydrate kinase [Verrucomicrobiota bacterium]